MIVYVLLVFLFAGIWAAAFAGREEEEREENSANKRAKKYSKKHVDTDNSSKEEMLEKEVARLQEENARLAINAKRTEYR